MPLLRTLRESCPNGKTCPKLLLGPDGDLFVRGYAVADPAVLAALDLPAGEAVVRIPAAAAAILLPELTMGNDPHDHRS